MKSNDNKIQYKGNEYRIVFDINVLETIQNQYGLFTNWFKLVNVSGNEEINLEALIFGIQEMLNEGIDIDNEDRDEKLPFLTHKQVGRIISEIGLQIMSEKMSTSIIDSSIVETKNA